jgi:hypothetical protein
VSDVDDATRLRILADDLGQVATAVPGVVRVQPRPGVGRFARRILTGLSAGSGAPSAPDVALTVGGTSTLVELDVVVDGAYSAPLVVRELAGAILLRLEFEHLPAAQVDVRIVAVS